MDQTAMLGNWYSHDPADSEDRAAGARDDERRFIEDSLNAQGIRHFAKVAHIGTTSEWRRKMWRIDFDWHGLPPLGTCLQWSKLAGCSDGYGTPSSSFLRTCQRHMIRHGAILQRDFGAEAHLLSDGQLIPKAVLILERGPMVVAKLNIFTAPFVSQNTRTPGLPELLASFVDGALGFERTLPMTGAWVDCKLIPEFRQAAAKELARSDELPPWERALLSNHGECLAPVTLALFQTEMEDVLLPPGWEREAIGEAALRGCEDTGGDALFRQEIADLLLFDYIIFNPDRFNGRNLKGIRGEKSGSNNKGSAEEAELRIIFWDNDRAFDHSAGLSSTGISLFEDPVAVPRDCVCVTKTTRERLARPKEVVKEFIQSQIQADPLAVALEPYFQAMSHPMFRRLERVNQILEACEAARGKPRQNK